jgi:hypothetical protein
MTSSLPDPSVQSDATTIELGPHLPMAAYHATERWHAERIGALALYCSDGRKPSMSFATGTCRFHDTTAGLCPADPPAFPAADEDGVIGARAGRHDTLDAGVDVAVQRPVERLTRLHPAVEQSPPPQPLPIATGEVAASALEWRGRTFTGGNELGHTRVSS